MSTEHWSPLNERSKLSLVILEAHLLARAVSKTNDLSMRNMLTWCALCTSTTVNNLPTAEVGQPMSYIRGFERRLYGSGPTL